MEKKKIKKSAMTDKEHLQKVLDLFDSEGGIETDDLHWAEKFLLRATPEDFVTLIKKIIYVHPGCLYQPYTLGEIIPKRNKKKKTEISEKDVDDIINTIFQSEKDNALNEYFKEMKICLEDDLYAIGISKNFTENLFIKYNSQIFDFDLDTFNDICEDCIWIIRDQMSDATRLVFAAKYNKITNIDEKMRTLQQKCLEKDIAPTENKPCTMVWNSDLLSHLDQYTLAEIKKYPYSFNPDAIPKEIKQVKNVRDMKKYLLYFHEYCLLDEVYKRFEFDQIVKELQAFYEMDKKFHCFKEAKQIFKDTIDITNYFLFVGYFGSLDNLDNKPVPENNNEIFITTFDFGTRDFVNEVTDYLVEKEKDAKNFAEIAKYIKDGTIYSISGSTQNKGTEVFFVFNSSKTVNHMPDKKFYGLNIPEKYRNFNPNLKNKNLDKWEGTYFGVAPENFKYFINISYFTEGEKHSKIRKFD